MLCFKMVGDYHRCLAELATGDVKRKVLEDAREAYAEATTVVARKDLVVTHPIHLFLAFQFEILKERIQERIVEDIIDVSLSHAMEETIEVVKSGPQEQVQFRTVEQIVFVSQIMEELVEVIRFVPQQRISKRLIDQIVGVSVPQIWQHCVEVAKKHTVEQIFDVPLPQIREEIGRRSTSFRKNEFLRASLGKSSMLPSGRFGNTSFKR